MSKFLSEVKGFTPVIDILAQELGLVTAVVYGIVWRYCQMENRVCTASLDRIAEHASISRRTVERHIKDLCDAGYLKDRTPGKRHRPHIYADTGRAKIKGLLTVEISTTESRTLIGSTTESQESATESRTEYDRESDLSTTESRIRRVSYDSSYKREEGEKTGKTPPEKPDPLLFDLARQTFENNESNYADPAHAGGDDLAAEAALTTLYTARGSEPPLLESNTYRLELEKVSQVLRDNGVTDPKISRLAARLICEANEKSPKFVNPHFRTFPSSFSYYLGVAKNRASAARGRRAHDVEAMQESLAALDDRRAAQTPPPQDDAVGRAVKDELEVVMGRNEFHKYVQASTFTCDDGALVITAPDVYARDWLEDRLRMIVERTLAAVADGPGEVRFEFEMSDDN